MRSGEAARPKKKKKHAGKKAKRPALVSFEDTSLDVPPPPTASDNNKTVAVEGGLGSPAKQDLARLAPPPKSREGQKEGSGQQNEGKGPGKSREGATAAGGVTEPEPAAAALRLASPVASLGMSKQQPARRFHDGRLVGFGFRDFRFLVVCFLNTLHLILTA